MRLHYQSSPSWVHAAYIAYFFAADVVAKVDLRTLADALACSSATPLVNPATTSVTIVITVVTIAKCTCTKYPPLLNITPTATSPDTRGGLKNRNCPYITIFNCHKLQSVHTSKKKF